MNNIYAVIMAGGRGERFWPASRTKTPKQLLKVVSDKSMLQETVNRVQKFIPKNRIVIVTNKTQVNGIKKQIPWLKRFNIISEPLSRNTAPCIAVTAKIISKKDKNAVMVVLPADHKIGQTDKFIKTIKSAVKVAVKDDALVTLGIKPHSPHTGYGYIKKKGKGKNGCSKVESFTEKPNLKTAKKYVKSGNYYWNSGMFVWKVSTILNEVKKYMPKMYKTINTNKSLKSIYSKVENISIDYGIMEKTKKAFVFEARFIWDDVGNWSALDKHFNKTKDGNIIKGDIITNNVTNSTIMTDNLLIGVVGVSDLIVIADKGAVLICPKDKSEDVKKIVNEVKKHKRLERYL